MKQHPCAKHPAGETPAISRRNFMQLASLAAAGALLSSCAKKSEEEELKPLISGKGGSKSQARVAVITVPEEVRMALVGKVVVAQGGGPTAVINQSLVGVVLESRKFPQVVSVYGAINGVLGILNEELFDFRDESPSDIEGLKHTPETRPESRKAPR